MSFSLTGLTAISALGTGVAAHGAALRMGAAFLFAGPVPEPRR